MKSSFGTSDLNILRKRPQRARWYTAIHQPRTVASMAFSTVPSHFPTSAIFVRSPIDGNPTRDVVEGMTLRVLYNDASVDYIRARGTMNAATSMIPIGESGCGLINWGEVNTIYALDEFTIWPKHISVSDDDCWLVDYKSYTCQLSLWGQIVNIGTPVVGFVNPDTNTYVGSFVGSRIVDLDNLGYTYTWRFPDGQTVTSKLGTESDPLLITFTGASPTGSYFSLTTESDAGSRIGRRLIFTYNDESQLLPVNIADIQGGIEAGGYEGSIEVLSTIPLEDEQVYREVVIFERASSGSAYRQSVGGNFPYRNNIVFRGWISDELTQINPYYSKSLFKLAGLQDIMRNAPAYDMFLVNSASPLPSDSEYDIGTTCTDWILATDLSIDRAALNLLHHRSTVGEIADFYPMSGIAMNPTSMLRYQDLPRSNLFEQLRLNYHDKGVLGHVGVDMQGSIYAFEDVLITGGSENIAHGLSLIKEDMRDTIEIQATPLDYVAQVQLYSVANETPFFAESPAKVTGSFGGMVSHQRGLFVDGDTLITWVGNLREKENSRFKSVTIPMAGNYRMDAIPAHRLTMSLSASDNSRGISWNNKEFLQKSLTANYDLNTGAVLTSIEMREIVDGWDGSAIDMPAIEDIVPIDPIPPTPEEEPPTPESGSGFGTVYVATADTLGRTRDFSATSPSWTDITPSAISAVSDFILDPWSPSTSGMISTNLGIYISEDLDLTTPSWTRILSNSEALTLAKTVDNALTTMKGYAFKMSGSINVQDYYAIFWQAERTNTSGRYLYCFYTYDRGKTWGCNRVSSTDMVFQNPAGFHKWIGAADYVPHLVSGGVVLYAAISTTSGVLLCKSSNGGSTWTSKVMRSTLWPTYADDVPSNALVVGHAPYYNNESGNIIYMGCKEQCWKYTWDTSTLNYISVSGNGVRARRHAIETWTQDNNQLGVWTVDNEFYLNYTGSTTFSAGDQVSATGISGTIFAAGGFPYVNNQYYVLTSTGIFASTDGGETFVNKTGDWAFGFNFDLGGEWDENGVGVIVPNWME